MCKDKDDNIIDARDKFKRVETETITINKWAKHQNDINKLQDEQINILIDIYSHLSETLKEQQNQIALMTTFAVRLNDRLKAIESKMKI